ncbi:MAG: PEP/pyruvate-binding domain-containing protein, partial [archaeon]
RTTMFYGGVRIMSSILSLHNVNETDYDKVGFKAVDLAKLHIKKLTIPLTFVITFKAFKAFMEENALNVKIRKIMEILDINSDRELVEAHDNIKELFNKAEIPEATKEELLEAYSTLSIDVNLDASKMVSAEEKPFVTLIRSPSYVIDPEDNEGIVQNVRGKHRFFSAIKKCWASLYSPKALLYRHLNDLGHDVETAIIVQKMINANISAVTYSRDLKSESEDMKIRTFFGFMDYHTPIRGDVHEVARESLDINDIKVNFQEYKIVRDPETYELEQLYLKEAGYQQKVNDKVVIEVARLTKRISGFLSKEVKCFFSIRNEKVYLTHCNKIIDLEKTKPQPQIIVEQAKAEAEPTPLEITAEIEDTPETSESEAEPSADPDQEDLGVNEPDRTLQDDLEFLDRLEEGEKELDEYAELEKELDQDKEEVVEKVEEELAKTEAGIEDYKEMPAQETSEEKKFSEEEEGEMALRQKPAEDNQEYEEYGKESEEPEEDNIFSDVKKNHDDE